MKVLWLWSSLLCALTMVVWGTSRNNVHGGPSYRLILDTDVDADDLFALLYLLKSNRSEFNLQVLSLKYSIPTYSLYFNFLCVASLLSFVFGCHCSLYYLRWCLKLEYVKRNIKLNELDWN
ncbi:putative ribonucleoside hydrolase [Helianthus anomalus]